jgi:hypothetical protein
MKRSTCRQYNVFGSCLQRSHLETLTQSSQKCIWSFESLQQNPSVRFHFTSSEDLTDKFNERRKTYTLALLSIERKQVVKLEESIEEIIEEFCTSGNRRMIVH